MWVWPPGLARPSSSRAVDVPPSSPENHISRTDRTLPTHGISTGLAVLSTTTVFGFAAATASTSWVLAAVSDAGAEIVAGEDPYGLGMVVMAPLSLRNTTASFLPCAAAAASAMSPPGGGVGKGEAGGAPGGFFEGERALVMGPPAEGPRGGRLVREAGLCVAGIGG